MSEPQLPQYPTLGRYQVINRIASGGMAEVFLARAVGAMGFQRLVAVKLIHANFTRDPDFVNMFIDEARIAMHLHHRNIVQVFDLDSEGQTYFIAMEFVHGVNLYDLYERIAEKGRWIEPPVALYLVAEISKGLHFAHTRTGADGHPLGIIHRDISPQNILLSFEGEVKIADFGIATAAERLHQTAAGIVKGKYAYMAPERLQEQRVDARVDVFSVGVLMYELLVGENPFAGASAVETIENVLGREVPAPSERGAPVSRRLDEICLRALKKDPAERYPSAHALADAVTEYAMELTVARKDMASGDAALAAILTELFPEKASSPPEAASQSLALPGVDEDLPNVSPPRDERHANPEALLQTDENLPVSDATVPTPVVGPSPEEDFDAPTILRLTPVKRPPTPEDPTRTHDVAALRRDSGLETLETPRDLQMTMDAAPTDRPTGLDESYESTQRALSARPPIADDPFAQTLPSRSNLESLGIDPIVPESRGDSATVLPPGPELPTPGRPGASSPGNLGSSPRPRSPAPNPTTAPHASAVTPGRPSSPSQSRVPSETSRSTRTTNPINLVATVLLALAAVVVVAALIIAQSREPTTVLVPVEVLSEPEGAFVKIGGQGQDSLTPMKVELSTQQVHVIELEKPGYRPVRREISPVDGSAVRLYETLEAVSGSVTIDPLPKQAQISIDGVAYGRGRKTITDQPLGQPIEILAAMEGFSPVLRQVTLSPETPHARVVIQLEKATGRRTARRKVALKAPYGTWAEVYFEGKLLGETTVTAFLPVGLVRLRVKNTRTGLDRPVTIHVPAKGPDEIELSF